MATHPTLPASVPVTLNVLSLFAGIGGLELGLERAGIRVIGQVEIDDYCRRVLAKHWPDVPRHDDVRTATEWWQSTERPTVDVICGGFPCQDISVAGRRAGIIEGERSSLWTYFAHTIRLLRPRYVLVENVSALLVRGLDVVVADLAEVGYDLRWDCVPAAAVGAPHRRDRWFGIAYTQRDELRLEPVTELGRGSASLVAVDGTERNVADAYGTRLEGAWVRGATSERGQETGAVPDAESKRRRQGWPGLSAGDGSYWARQWPQALADTRSERRDRDARLEGTRWHTPVRGEASNHPSDSGASRFRPADHWAVEPDVGRVAHGVPARVDRLRALGNAVVPQVAEYVGRLIVTHAEQVAA